MTMPYRLFYRFHSVVLQGQDINNDYTTAVDWLNVYSQIGQMGYIKWYSLGNNMWNRWTTLFRGFIEDDFAASENPDQICRIDITGCVGVPNYNQKPITDIVISDGVPVIPAAPDAWANDSATGKYYDGVNEYASYPLNIWIATTEIINVAVADLPKEIEGHCPAWNMGVGLNANAAQDHFWRNGYGIFISDSTPAQATWGGDDGVRCDFVPYSMKVVFFNALTNSLNRYSMPTAGLVTVLLNGLGFQNDEDEIEYGGSVKPGGWGDSVNEIYFEGLQGQGNYTIYLAPYAGNEFIINSNNQIEITTMPAMAAGTYQIKTRKGNHGTAKNIDSYAGDWRCDTDGRIYPGTRIIFTVADDGDGDGEEDPVIYIKWPWKSRTTTIFKYWAPIDTRTPDIFFEGKILDLGSFERSPSDISGLAQVSDLTIEIANHDQEISMLLAEYECLNQAVSFWWGFRNDPYNWKSYLCSMVVTDYEKPDSTWRVTLRDVNARYF